MKTVLVAGATGYLGRHIVDRYMSTGWHVRALVRNAELAHESSLGASELIEGQATQPETLIGFMDGVDLVISTLGITRQRDGLTYWDVDYQANANLLDEALRAKVSRFAYVHVLNAKKLQHVPLVAAKQAFADRLQRAPIPSTIVSPSGFFSDMADFLHMAEKGRVWLFGVGKLKLNPIDGADLADFIACAIQDERSFASVGGPEILTQNEIARAAFHALGKTPRISLLPDVLRRAAIKILPFTSSASVRGPILFFLSVLGMEMVGEPCGKKRLSEHFSKLVRNADAAKDER